MPVSASCPSVSHKLPLSSRHFRLRINPQSDIPVGLCFSSRSPCQPRLQRFALHFPTHRGTPFLGVSKFLSRGFLYVTLSTRLGLYTLLTLLSAVLLSCSWLDSPFTAITSTRPTHGTMSFSAIFSSSSSSTSGSRDSASSVSSIGSSILPRGLVDYIAAHTHHGSSYPTTSFQVVSDLHLEMESDTADGGYATYTVARTAPYLILAGDIGSLNQPDHYLAFLRRHTAIFDRVFLVLGNHEFYGTSRREGLANAQMFVDDDEIDGKLTLLHRARFDVDDNVTILGCTLHSAVTLAQRANVSRSLNDFNKIQDWSVDDHNAEHSIDIAWLRDQVEEIANTDPTRRILVVTHHAPSYRKTSAPQHEDSPLNSGFCTGILEGGQWRGWKGKEMVKSWVYGHTHWCTDVNIGGVRVVSNQRGYWFEQKVRSMYKDEFVLEV